MAHSVKINKMKNLCKILSTISIIAVSILAIDVSHAQTPVPNVKINAYGIHFGGQVVYRYQVENYSGEIDTVEIGTDNINEGLPAQPWTQETNGSDIPVIMPLNRCKPFSYMRCQAVVYQFDYMPSPKSMVIFSDAQLGTIPMPSTFTKIARITKGKLSSVAEITVPTENDVYLKGKATVRFISDFERDLAGKAITSAVIPITISDLEKPKLSASMQFSNSNGFTKVAISLKATDNLDPAPKITYVKFSSSEVIASGDVVMTPENDRIFTVKAVSGRTYYFYYRVSDGSGNSETYYVGVYFS